MRTQRVAQCGVGAATAAKRLTTFIVPSGAHLVVGAIAPSRFYAVEFAKTADRCKEATVRQPALPAFTSAEV